MLKLTCFTSDDNGIYYFCIFVGVKSLRESRLIHFLRNTQKLVTSVES